jgi:hypothetical protein
MKYLLIFATLLYALVTPAATVQERLESVQNAPGVLAAQITRTPAALPRFGQLYTAAISWYLTTGDFVRSESAELIIVELGTENEAAYWLDRVPAILVVPPVIVYMADRTASTVTAAMIESFCNSTWTAAAPGAGQTGAASIREFEVTPVDGRTVRVNGMFNLVANGGSWERRTYLIRLVDPNGQLTLASGNIKFERVAE